MPGNDTYNVSPLDTSLKDKIASGCQTCLYANDQKSASVWVKIRFISTGSLKSCLPAFVTVVDINELMMQGGIIAEVKVRVKIIT